jgi:hypothetical protein
MFGADDRLSRAASAIWRQRQDAYMDYALDASGDCGPLIAKAHRRSEVEALARLGFTPESYNAAIEQRIGGPGYTAHRWASELEVESDEQWHDRTTLVGTGSERSSLAYLKQ